MATYVYKCVRCERVMRFATELRGQGTNCPKCHVVDGLSFLRKEK